MPDSPDPAPLPRPVTAPHQSLEFRSARDRLDELIGRLPDIGWAGVAFVVIFVAGLAAWALTRPDTEPPLEVSLPLLAPASIPTVIPAMDQPGPGPTTIVVHVAGAVAAPGVYELDPADRVGDAIAAAGGALPAADLDRVNLAAILIDASQVYVPEPGETPIAPASPAGPLADGASPIDLNRATTVELEELPGVGPATAAAIVAHREEHGPFTSVTALDDVAGIGPTRLEALRDLVTVGQTSGR